jgi:hypothetical protein
MLTADLCGSLPDIADDAKDHSGLTHVLKVENKYFSVTVGVWVDEFTYDVNDAYKGYNAWATAFSSHEAKEVRDVVGGVIYLFDASNPKHKEASKCIAKFLARLNDEGWDGVAIAASHGTISEEEQDDLYEDGFEYVDMQVDGKDSMGELQGVPRIREALEFHMWSTSGGHIEEPEDGHKAALAGAESLAEALTPILELNDASDSDLQALEAFMTRLQVVKGTSIFCCVFRVVSRTTACV